MEALNDSYYAKIKATRNFNMALEEHFPIGSSVMFSILPDQLRDRTGTVVNYLPHGCLRVRDTEVELLSLYSHRGVFFGDVTKI